MKWARPEYGPGRVVAAGKVLAGRKQASDEMSLSSALDIAGNWRSSHGYPLQTLGMTLRRRARKIDPKALFAQRLKRLPSIMSKLQRFPSMQLSTMQDLGGCRAVVSSIGNVQELVKLYESQPCSTAQFVEKYDYVSNPKADGYRGVHLVYRYQNGHQERAVYNRSKIEIQIRSRAQHIWSTAVEIIDTFTNQALKTGLGDPAWQRFFALMSDAIAVGERCPSVPGAHPDDPLEFLAELRRLCRQLHVVDVLSGLTVAVDGVSKARGKTFILILDSKQERTGILGFADDAQASQEYLRLEKENINNPDIQTVMVSVDSVAALRKAYPNYFLDTGDFLHTIDMLMNLGPKKKKKKKARRKAVKKIYRKRSEPLV
jgi:hypothetical protein